MPNPKIRILRIIARLNIGGPAIHTLLLTSGLNAAEFESLLVSGVVSDEEGDMSYLAKEYGVKPTILSELKRDISWKDDLVALYKLYRLIKTLKPDIVDTHTAKAGTLGRIAAILAGVPSIVHTFHGHVFHSYFGRVKSLFFVLIERFLARFTNKIIVISALQYDELCHKFRIAPLHKFAVIPLGFDLNPFLNAEVHRGKLRRELGIPDDVLLVGIVGRLTAIKNHELFLRSARRIAEKSPNVQFIVVGGGELEFSLKRLAKDLGLGGKVFFLGWREDIPRIYADLDIVALTSLNEGTPVCVIEAMASAKPVVATAVGGVADVVAHGKTGYIVSSIDESEFSAAVVNLLQDAAKRQRFGQFGREKVRKEFTKERLFADMESFYKGLLSSDKEIQRS